MLRNEGEIITHKTVERLMRAEGLHASRKRRYRPTTDSTRTLGPHRICCNEHSTFR
ncbi:MAG: transposase [Ignavibacteria bacterium]|nr:transposase [Ignavibacteria bacterium]